jgi:hypothetical protein
VGEVACELLVLLCEDGLLESLSKPLFPAFTEELPFEVCVEVTALS